MDNLIKATHHKKGVTYQQAKQIEKTIFHMVGEAIQTYSALKDSPEALKEIKKNTHIRGGVKRTLSLLPYSLNLKKTEYKLKDYKTVWQESMHSREKALKNYESKKENTAKQAQYLFGEILFLEIFECISTQEIQIKIERFKRNRDYGFYDANHIDFGIMQRIRQDILNSPTIQNFKQEIAFACSTHTTETHRLEQTQQTLSQEKRLLATIEQQLNDKDYLLADEALKLSRELAELKQLAEMNRLAEEAKQNKPSLTSPAERLKALQALLERKRRGG